MLATRSFTAAVTLILSAAGPLAAQRGTSRDITVGDLRARMSIFADDSMGGRGTGTPGHQKGVNYLVAELTRLGLRPAGDNGTFVQAVPLVHRVFDSTSAVTLGGRPLRAGVDYEPRNVGNNMRAFRNAPIVFGGRFPDTLGMLPGEQAVGKVVVILPPGFTPESSTVFRAPVTRRFIGAAAIVIANLEVLSADDLAQFRSAFPGFAPRPGGAETPSYLHVSRPVLERMFGRPAAQLAVGDAGGVLDGEVRYRDQPLVTNNVVAMVPGTDPALRGQIVALGAHSDAIGIVGRAEHDSVRAWMTQLTALQEQGLQGQALFDAAQRIRVNVDSLRAIRPGRVDSIVNGADDDGSGSMGLLEMAELFARRPTRRSLLFVWHVGEEQGLFGADHFTRNPTVPRDSIVAQLNIDMIGRGAAGDLPNGGPGYLQLIGTRRLSTQLGDLVEEVNRSRRRPFVFDYQYDAPGHPENFYCRSDHYMYARYGIPIAFFTTGGHRDYHQVTDEAAYIDFDKLMQVSQLVADVGRRLGDAPARPVVDGQRPASIEAPCRQ